ncbi:hypothetical protein AALO_G00280250 [Alosa alosa]|uniref:Uncharacterized protein n=1 Tax=Alosa alosa TaxID=278164 RepID=A0AAV6FKC2_9TELE|nr:hypothetical protein AALO_G00280250 [Alosa alosa]
MVTWRGINGKVSFEKLHIKAVVIDAVRRNPVCSAATDADIAQAIKRWLGKEGGKNACQQPTRNQPMNELTFNQINNLINTMKCI